ncbi:hypothetical protein J5N97_000350 [Dioscorea zingiberensis]|uniref:DDT domain-containing protein DDR4 n=1 Tax=Dioscorea zingiberensis TaxID=325984 RepID=A0A9D5H1K7_9LILI|nr:hypothetical protein J5N97_000350 [Dioscorea zingiberensis]
MAEKRGRGRPPTMEDVIVVDDQAPDPAASEQQISRLRLRQRWELASVLNFLHVFEPLIQSGLRMSGEEIEECLIKPNDALASLHIAILKGIPPVTKNLNKSDAWVTAVCKKLSSWWPWVAEGENPFGPDQRESIERYKELDETSRLLILKALCEVRAEQDDIVRYISDALKEGSNPSTFRKETIGSDDNGTTYWYDGDPIIGHRLYREIIQVKPKQRSKGKGSSTKPVVDSHWETLATNLEEFRKISEKLSSGKIMSEVVVAKIINSDIIPVLEKYEKERALKRRQRESLLLDNLLNYSGIGSRCSHRTRRPVKYTFDDYDQAIDEAIQISKKPKTEVQSKGSNQKADHESLQNTDSNGTLDSEKDTSNLDEDHNGQPETDDDVDFQESAGDADVEDDDYSEKDGDYDDTYYDSDKTSHQEKDIGLRKQKDVKTKMIIQLRRSGRTSGNIINGHTNNVVTIGHAEMKKRLRQRPTRTLSMPCRSYQTLMLIACQKVNDMLKPSASVHSSLPTSNIQHSLETMYFVPSL